MILVAAIALILAPQTVTSKNAEAPAAEAAVVDVIVDVEGGGVLEGGGGENLPLPPIEGSILVYGFNEGGGGQTYDYSGNGHPGSVSKLVTWKPGYEGSAVSFSKGAYVVNNGVSLLSEWTLQAWTRFPLPLTSGGSRVLMQNDAFTEDTMQQVGVNPEGYFSVRAGGAIEKCGINLDQEVSDGWHLVTVAGRDGKTVFYIDSKEVGAVGLQVAGPMSIFGNGLVPDCWWGPIDCLRILDYMRSTDEIAQDAAWGAVETLPTPTPDPILPVIANTRALYSLGEGAGYHRAADSSPNAYTADIVGPATWEPALIGTGLRFSGYGNVLSTPSIELGSSWTIQAWTQFPLPATDDGMRALVSYSSLYSHVVVGSEGDLGLMMGSFRRCGYNTVSLTGWHLLSAVGSGGTTTFYVDGTPAGAAEGQITFPVLGIGNAGVNASQPWGLIDGVRLLGVTRTAAEIMDDANPTPNLPTGAAQFDGNGAAVAAGGSIHGGFSVKAGVSEIISLPVKLQVEVKPAGSAFDGTTGITSGNPAASGTTASVWIDRPAVGAYQWRVRAVNATGGQPSAWVDFGGAGTDVQVTNGAPSANSWALHRGSDGAIVTGAVYDSEGVQFEVTPSDVDHDRVQVLIEVAPRGAAFSGTPTLAGAFVASGEVVLLGNQPAHGRYAWRFQVLDENGASSAWMEGGEFEVAWAGSSMSSGCSALPSAGGLLAGLVVLLAARRRAA